MASISDIILIGVLSLVVISTANFTLTTNRYFDLINANTPASITITLLESGCAECEILGDLIDVIKSEDLKVKVEIKETLGSIKSRSYVNKFGIERLPAVVVEGEIDKLPAELLEIFDNRENALVFETPIGLYFDVKTESVRGRVNIIYLSDATCTDCYDVKVHNAALGNLGIYLDNAVSYDISDAEGGELVERYNITKVPTIILSGDTSSYVGFDQIWAAVGTVETDGAYVFREMDQITGAVFSELS